MVIISGMPTHRAPAVVLLCTAGFEFVLGGLFVASAVIDAEPSTQQAFFMTGGVLILTGLVMAFVGVRFLMSARVRDRIHEEGVAGQAEVLQMRQTGLTMNNSPRVQLDLRVTTPLHGTYDVTVKEFVPIIMTGRLWTGQPLNVRVDPNDRTGVLIEW